MKRGADAGAATLDPERRRRHCSAFVGQVAAANRLIFSLLYPLYRGHLQIGAFDLNKSPPEATFSLFPISIIFHRYAFLGNDIFTQNKL